MAAKKRLATYYAIYQLVYANPNISQTEIAQNTKIPQSTVSKYLQEMYASSVIKGPMICVKPAHNYQNYAHFLTFENPLTVYRRIKGFPYIISRNLSSGAWNLLLVCERMVNFSQFKGFTSSFFGGIKGVTHIPKVRFLEWDQSMKHMYQLLSCPKEKSTLYREGPPICWNNKEWILYQNLKWNTRVHTHYHTQLADILGMLPATSVFFSVGDSLFARVSFLDRKQEQDLYTFIFQLEEKGFYTHFHTATVLSPSVI